MCKSREMLLVNRIFALCISPIKMYLSKKVMIIFVFRIHKILAKKLVSSNFRYGGNDMYWFVA